jgi:hypothetical protein
MLLGNSDSGSELPAVRLVKTLVTLSSACDAHR